MTTPAETLPVVPEKSPGRRGPGEQNRAVLLVVASALSVQVGAAFATKLLPHTGAAGGVTLRLVIAAVVLLAWTRPKVRGLSRADWGVVLGLGVAFAGMNYTFYEGLARLPLGPAVTLEFLGPLTLALVLSRRARDLVWVALAGGGVALLGLGEGHGFGGLDPVGIAFILTAGACWAAYIVLASKTSKRFKGVDGLALAVGVAAVLVAPVGFAQAGPRMFEPDVLALGAAVAVMSSVLPYSFEMLAIKHLPPSAFGLLASLEPAVAATAGFLILGQSLAWVQVGGILLVVLASGGVTLAGRGA
jgi:inner membrane transporter RhtA